MSPNAGGGGEWGSGGVSANEYSCTHGAQINFGDLTPYLTYGEHVPAPQGVERLRDGKRESLFRPEMEGRT
jgi:hypothetical protein